MEYRSRWVREGLIRLSYSYLCNFFPMGTQKLPNANAVTGGIQASGNTTPLKSHDYNFKSAS